MPPRSLFLFFSCSLQEKRGTRDFLATARPSICRLTFRKVTRTITIARVTTKTNRLTLLLADTDGTTSSASGLGMLTTDTQAPVVSQTTMGADLLQALQILTQLALHAVGQDLVVLAVDDVALSVEEPAGDLVLGRVLDDGDNSFEFFRSDFTGSAKNIYISPPVSFLFPLCEKSLCLPLVQINIGLLANQVGITTADTLDPGQGVHDLLFAIDIGVEETKDELDCRFTVRIGHGKTRDDVAYSSTSRR